MVLQVYFDGNTYAQPLLVTKYFYNVVLLQYFYLRKKNILLCPPVATGPGIKNISLYTVL